MADPDPVPDPLEDLVAECLRRRSLDGVMPVDELCARHPALADALRARLRALHDVGLAATAAVPPPAADPGPQQIGPYRILDRLGEGGMGTVWLAEQKTPVRRRVALKVIKLGMDSKQVLARFEAERQALAMMEHDHIAKVFDAGTTDRGQPYFVMEYVKGVPITDHCDRHRLPTRERLRLFQQVCDAVQHAHHKGVIHRDLKPSNILVSEHEGHANAKVIDFGLARATDHRLVEATIFTEHGQLLGTPEYMSPEQAEMTSAEVDTRTDVYSLGVLLYELLVGELPFSGKELRAAGLFELRRKIREDEPPRPSTRLSSLGEDSATTAQRRHTTTQVLLRELRGDLDWIVMRAMEKERQRRYQTPRELEQEISRFLADEPVLAGPPSAGYRLRKLAQRHRGPLLAATLVAACLVAALVTSLCFYTEAHDQAMVATAAKDLADRKAREAEDRREEAQRAREAKDAALVATRDALRRETGLRYCAQATTQLSRDPGLATALANLGHTLVSSPESERTLRQALATCRETTTDYVWIGDTPRRRDWSPDLRTFLLLADPSAEVVTLLDTTTTPMRRVALSLPDAVDADAATALPVNGTWMAVAGHDRVHVRTRGGESVLELPGRFSTLLGCGPAQDLVLAAEDGRVAAVAVRAEGVVRELIPAGSRIRFLRAATAKPRLLVVTESELCIVDADSGAKLATTGVPPQRAPAYLLQGDIAIDGRSAFVWEPYSGTLLTWSEGAIWREHRDPSQRYLTPFRDHLFDPTHQRLLLGCMLGCVKIWDLASGSVQEQELPGGDPTAFALAPNGRDLAVGMSNGTIAIHDATTWTGRGVLRRHGGEVVALHYSSPTTLRSFATDGTLRTWRIDAPIGQLPLLARELHRLCDLFSPLDGSTSELAKGTHPTVDRGPPGRLFQRLGRAAPTMNMAWRNAEMGVFAPDGHSIATYAVTADGLHWKLVDATTLATRRELPIAQATFSRDGRHLVGHRARKLAIVATDSDAPAIELERSEGCRESRFSAGGRHVVAVQWTDESPPRPTATVRVWDAGSGALLATIDEPTSRVACTAIAAAGDRLVIGRHDGVVVVHDLIAPYARVEFTEHSGGVYAVALAVDGTQVISGGHDGSIRVRDVATRHPLATSHGDGAPVMAVALSDDGQWLHYGTAGGTVAAEPVDVTTFANSKAPRSLTPGELTALAVGDDEQRRTATAAWYAAKGLPPPPAGHSPR